MMTRFRTSVVIVALLVSSPGIARADVVLEWNALAVATFIAQGQNPFAQARFAAITQLAVFEAVNAVTRRYDPYIGVVAPVGASAEAAAVAAAHAVLKAYFPNAAAIDEARQRSLAAIPDGPAKSYGIATGVAAAEALIARRANDGSTPPAFHVPASLDPGVWQPTPGCPPEGGILFHWQNVTPFGIPSAEAFLLGPPPELTSRRYAKDYAEVKAVGGRESDHRPPDRAEVATFYAMSSPTYVFNLVARQVATAQGRSLSHNARALALLNMAANDSLIVSFLTKYHYNLWRPETAIHAGDADGNRRTRGNVLFAPYIVTPCFPSYPSNHASGSNGAAEILRRVYGSGGHSIVMSNPSVPGVTLHYTKFRQISDDIDDARVFGGIHFRFDQEAGVRLGRKVATYVYKHHLQRADRSDKGDRPDRSDSWK